MIKIKRANLETTAIEFCSHVVNVVKRKSAYKAYSKVVREKIQEIYILKVEDLTEDTHQALEDFFYNQNNIDKDELLNNCFKYNNAKDWKIKSKANNTLSYWLAMQLDIKTCPYCNRQYTFTAINDTRDTGRTRPEFDHFLPKNKYRLFALSFFNLIPSCHTCNHLKSTEEVHINPYKSDFGEDCKFILNDFPSSLLENKYDIDFSNKENYKSNIKTLCLLELYKQHTDYIEEIVKKGIAYNKGYYDSLLNDLPNLGITENEMSRIIFGNYIDKAEHENRPLSKLTKDILDQIGIK